VSTKSNREPPIDVVVEEILWIWVGSNKRSYGGDVVARSKFGWWWE